VLSQCQDEIIAFKGEVTGVLSQIQNEKDVFLRQSKFYQQQLDMLETSMAQLQTDMKEQSAEFTA
jgi:hypothetical protein